MNKSNCTKKCKGIIKKIKVRGLEYSSRIIVEFQVNGIIYEIIENLVMKPKIIKLGFLPIGYTSKSIIEINTNIETRAGNEVNVLYNPNNPTEAYLPDND